MRKFLLNNVVLTVYFYLNLFISLFGGIFFGMSLYLLIGELTDNNEGYSSKERLLDYPLFIFSICLLFIGLIFIIEGIIGSQAIEWQGVFYENISGRKITFIHFCILLSVIVMILFVLNCSLVISTTFNDVAKHLETSPSSSIPFTFLENEVADFFNLFYFQIANSCSSFYIFFWDLIDSKCPLTMSKSNCMGCDYYSMRFCSVEEYLCENPQQAPVSSILLTSFDDNANIFCPYIQCRKELLYYFSDVAKKLNYSLYAFLVFFIIFLCFNFMLFAYTNHKKLLKNSKDFDLNQ